MVRVENIVIVTGISGAGKTTILNTLEDLGYVTMDNLPCRMGNFILDTYSNHGKVEETGKIAIGMDIRSFKNINEYIGFIEKIKSVSKKFEIIFIEAEDEVLLNRYNLTRRRHPLIRKTLEESIRNEKEIMNIIKEHATFVIDSSYITTKQLVEKVLEVLEEKNEEVVNMTVHIESFGFKYGIPKDVDMIFDVRFLPNPYYIKELKEKTGNEKDVQEYVMSSEVSYQFKDKLFDMINFLIPNFIKEGKKHITIGIGCSGGKHRSVTFVNLLEKELLKYKNLRVFKTHREEERGHWKR